MQSRRTAGHSVRFHLHNGSTGFAQGPLLFDCHHDAVLRNQADRSMISDRFRKLHLMFGPALRRNNSGDYNNFAGLQARLQGAAQPDAHHQFKTRSNAGQIHGATR